MSYTTTGQMLKALWGEPECVFLKHALMTVKNTYAVAYDKLCVV